MLIRPRNRTPGDRRTHTSRVATFTGIGLLVVTGMSESASPPPMSNAPVGGSLSLRCGAAWDARSGYLSGPVSIKVVDGSIVSVERASGAMESGDIDLSHSTCLPGLIDAHTHVMLQSDRLEGDYDRQLLKESNEYRTIIATRHAARMLQWGFTSIRDLGSEGAGYADVAIREAIDNGIIPGPRMQVATLAIAATGAYPLLGYAPHLNIPKGVEEASGVEAGRESVRRQISNGADVIKVYADRSPRQGAAGRIDTYPTLTIEELSAIIDEAHRQGRKAAVHARAAQGAANALKAGADSIEHGDYLDDDNLRVMASKGVFYVPTFDTDEQVTETRVRAGASIWTYVREVKKKTLARAVKAGVKIAFGSDVGGADWIYNPAGAFRFMTEAGMTPEQVLKSATLNAAELMGVEDRVGTLQPGKLADIIAVPGNPLEDVRVLERVSFVVKGGNRQPATRADD